MSHGHHHHHHPSPSDVRYRETRNITLIGSAVDLLLGVGKIIIGLIGGSQVLVADGIHSLSDLATDFAVIIGAKHANREADENHPYGHGRIETAVTVGLGVALIVVALGICGTAVYNLIIGNVETPGIATLWMAIVSIVFKEAIYHYTMHYAKKLRSKMLEANAWHSRTDAFSSVIAVIGILGAMAGFNYLDSVAAIVVGIIIIRVGWKLAWASVQELVDVALDPDEVDEIKALIMTVNGVKDMHFLRTRKMGSDALVDVHIQVDSELSVSEGHLISETVRHKLIKKIDQVIDVLVHIDPENDEEGMAGVAQLPMRENLLAELKQRWQTIIRPDAVKKVTLHYLEGKIRVELVLALDEFQSQEKMQQVARDLRQAILTHPHVSKASIQFAG